MLNSASVKFLKTHGSLLFLFLVLSGSLALNIVLGLKLQRHPTTTRVVGVRERVQLDAIPVVDGNGTNLTIKFDDRRPTVLYILAPHCPWSARNRANIEALAAAAKSGYTFIGLSNTDTGFREYVAGGSLPFPVYELNSKTLLDNAKQALVRELDPTPQTIVVGPGGEVQKVWVGALDEQAQSEVERFFSVGLPGLIDGDPIRKKSPLP
jgi:hypothetical protein